MVYLSYQDYKTSFVDARIVFIFLITSIVFFFFRIYNHYNLNLTIYLILILILIIIGYISYKMGYLGIGDTFLLIITLLYFGPWILLWALYFSVIFSLIYSLKYFKKILLSLLILENLIILTELVYKFKIELFLMIISIPPLIISILLKKQIQEKSIRFLPLNKIQEQDLLAIEFLDEKILKKYNIKSRLITKETFNKLKEISKKENIKEFPINYELIRYYPFMFLGVILSFIIFKIL